MFHSTKILLILSICTIISLSNNFEKVSCQKYSNSTSLEQNQNKQNKIDQYYKGRIFRRNKISSIQSETYNRCEQPSM